MSDYIDTLSHIENGLREQINARAERASVDHGADITYLMIQLDVLLAHMVRHEVELAKQGRDDPE